MNLLKKLKVKLMFFGHRIYKNFDPRAKINKGAWHDLLEKLVIHNEPLLKIAKKLEGIALNDEYFTSKKLYSNVDFYSGIIFSALNLPPEMFAVFFALGSMSRWCAQWLECAEDPKQKITRPRQIYTSKKERGYTPHKSNLSGALFFIISL